MIGATRARALEVKAAHQTKYTVINRNVPEEQRAERHLSPKPGREICRGAVMVLLLRRPKVELLCFGSKELTNDTFGLMPLEGGM
jgi:hypothetical protein